MVRKKKFFKVREMSGNFILVSENWNFEEKSGAGKSQIVTLLHVIPSKVRRNISGQMSAKDSSNRRLEAAIISEILHLFGQGNLTFIREKSRNFEN